MANKRHIIKMMADALPRCPICGSNIGYETVSVLKGVVRCKACRAEWSSRDFFRSDRLRSLVLRELPEGRHTLACEEYTLRRYEEYPIEFWRSLAKINRQFPSIEYRGIIRVGLLSVLVFLAAFIPRFLLIDETSIMTDEPLYVSAGRLYIQGLLSLNFGAEVWQLNAEHPPIAKLLIGASSYIFAPLLGGENVHNMYFAARLAPVTAGTLICIFIYLVGRRHYGEDTALLGALLAAFSPWLIYYSTLAILDIFAAFFLTLTFLLLPLVKGINRHLVLVGIFSGLALGSKGTAIAVFPGIALYLLLKMLVGESREGVKGLRMIALQFLLISIIA
ncbi:MAG: glycosyltransferase family 39 protein, partial [Candidatus Bathyarchaeia archaeon]